MAVFLKIVSGFYLVVVWAVFAIATIMPAAQQFGGPATQILLFLACVTLSIPAVALFAFGQIVGDVRSMRDHLRAMRQYYEPQQ